MSPETAHAIDQIQVNLNAGGMNTINIILAFVMFGVALGIKPGIFVEVYVHIYLGLPWCLSLQCKNLHTMQETQIGKSWEDPPENRMATCSSIGQRNLAGYSP